MDRRSGQKDVDAGGFRFLQRLPGRIDVLFHGPGQADHRRPLHVLGHRLNRLKISRGRGSKTGFNGIHPQLLQLESDLHLFRRAQVDSRRLFTVPERRIKDLYGPHGATPSQVMIV